MLRKKKHLKFFAETKYHVTFMRKIITWEWRSNTWCCWTDRDTRTKCHVTLVKRNIQNKLQCDFAERKKKVVNRKYHVTLPSKPFKWNRDALKKTINRLLCQCLGSTLGRTGERSGREPQCQVDTCILICSDIWRCPCSKLTDVITLLDLQHDGHGKLTEVIHEV